MKAALLGKKLGMTSIYREDGKHIPCTVVEAGPCPITLVRTVERDGYSAVQIAFGEVKDRKVSMPKRGHFDKINIKPLKHLKEFRNPDQDYSEGDEFTVENFQVGDKVKISGKSKGRGFQGVMKRHNFSGVGMQSHGQKDRERHPGSIGQSSYPSRVFKGIRMAGQMGGNKVSLRNLEVVDIIPEQNLLLLKGAVPGAPNSLIEIVKQ